MTFEITPILNRYLYTKAEGSKYDMEKSKYIFNYMVGNLL